MDIPICILTAFCCGMVLLFFYFKNENKNVERFLFKKNKKLYYALTVSYFILMVSLVYNIKFVINHYFDILKARFGLV